MVEYRPSLSADVAVGEHTGLILIDPTGEEIVVWGIVRASIGVELTLIWEGVPPTREEQRLLEHYE